MVEVKKRFSSPIKSPDLLWRSIESSIMWVLGHFLLGEGAKVKCSHTAIPHICLLGMQRLLHPRADHEGPEEQQIYLYSFFNVGVT